MVNISYEQGSKDYAHKSLGKDNIQEAGNTYDEVESRNKEQHGTTNLKDENLYDEIEAGSHSIHNDDDNDIIKKFDNGTGREHMYDRVEPCMQQDEVVHTFETAM